MILACIYLLYWMLGIISITCHWRCTHGDVRFMDFLFIIILASLLGPLYQVATLIENKFDFLEYVIIKGVK